MDEYKQKIIQHLGIIAGICNEIGLIKIIDAEIEKSKRKVTVGQAVQSIILNALGFSGRAMYLHPEYYRKRPVELLVGEGIESEDLNENCLGSALDALFDYGVTELFYKVASRALSTYNIEHQYSTRVKNTYGKKGQPDASQVPVGLEWYIHGNLVIDASAVGEAQGRKGFFIIATNELDEKRMTSRQLLDV